MKIHSTMCIVSLINELAFPRPDPQWGAEHLQAHPGLVQLVTSENEGIPAVHIKHPGAFFTVLYSHGNAEDVSISLDYLHDMAAALQCNIFVTVIFLFLVSAAATARTEVHPRAKHQSSHTNS